MVKHILRSGFLIFAMLFAAGSAFAAGHFHGHSNYRGSYFHGGSRIILAAPIVYPYPRYYYPAVIPEPAEPVTYVEQASNVWYYCASARAYYPYVANCPEEWQQVNPQ